METGRSYTGAIQSTAVTVTTGVWNNLAVHFDEGSATTGTVVVTVIPPGLTEAKTYATSTYTVGTTIGLQLLDVAFGSVVLTPATVDAEMTYGLSVWSS